MQKNVFLSRRSREAAAAVPRPRRVRAAPRRGGGREFLIEIRTRR